MTKYTLAIGDGILLATVPDGEDIDAAVVAEMASCNADHAPGYKTVTGCTLTDDNPGDDADLIWHSGNCGWIIDENGRDWRFAVREG